MLSVAHQSGVKAASELENAKIPSSLIATNGGKKPYVSSAQILMKV
jgi:hypothetical protein